MPTEHFLIITSLSTTLPWINLTAIAFTSMVKANLTKIGEWAPVGCSDIHPFCNFPIRNAQPELTMGKLNKPEQKHILYSNWPLSFKNVQIIKDKEI